MPSQNHELWDKIDQLAKEASEEHGDHRTAYILTQVAVIGRTYKRQGVKLLLDVISLHCAKLLSDATAAEFPSNKKG